MPGNHCGCIQYDLEVQRMIDEGGAIFQEYLSKEKDPEKDVDDSKS